MKSNLVQSPDPRGKVHFASPAGGYTLCGVEVYAPDWQPVADECPVPAERHCRRCAQAVVTWQRRRTAG